MIMNKKKENDSFLEGFPKGLPVPILDYNDILKEIHEMMDNKEIYSFVLLEAPEDRSAIPLMLGQDKDSDSFVDGVVISHKRAMHAIDFVNKEGKIIDPDAYMKEHPELGETYPFFVTLGHHRSVTCPTSDEYMDILCPSLPSSNPCTASMAWQNTDDSILSLKYKITIRSISSAVEVHIFADPLDLELKSVHLFDMLWTSSRRVYVDDDEVMDRNLLFGETSWDICQSEDGGHSYYRILIQNPDLESNPIPSTKPSFITSFSHTSKTYSLVAKFAVKNPPSYFMKGTLPMATYQFNSFHLNSVAQVSDDVDSDLGMRTCQNAFTKKTERWLHAGKREIVQETSYSNPSTSSSYNRITEKCMQDELDKMGYTMKKIGFREHLLELNDAVKKGHWPFGDKLPCSECNSYDCDNEECVDEEEE